MLPVVGGVCNMGLMNQAPTRLWFGRSAHRGVQRGTALLHLFLSPKIENPPQAEWGTQGVDSDFRQRRKAASWIPASAGMTEGVWLEPLSGMGGALVRLEVLVRLKGQNQVR